MALWDTAICRLCPMLLENIPRKQPISDGSVTVFVFLSQHLTVIPLHRNDILFVCRHCRQTDSRLAVAVSVIEHVHGP